MSDTAKARHIFLDVGAHTGQTARVVLDRRYAFDKVYCFEPSSRCWPSLEALRHPALEICRFGLGRQTGEHTLYAAGGVGASVIEDLAYIQQDKARTETVRLVRASEWSEAHLRQGDVVIMKLNCEGSECDIIEDLLESGGIGKFYNIMVEFDIRYSPSQNSREWALRRRLRATGWSNVIYGEDVIKGATHEARTQNWLRVVGAQEPLDLAALRAKYGPVLSRLAERTGWASRAKYALHREVYSGLPPQVKSGWRAIRQLPLVAGFLERRGL